MKIYLKRDKSDENSRYIVFSENGDCRYKISGRHTRSSHHMYVTQGEQCVAKIRETNIALIRSCYVTSKDGNFHLTVTLSKRKFAVAYHGVTYHIRGDVLNKSYDILDIDNSVVACVCRRFSTSHDALEINLNNEKSEIVSIATAVCLDGICTTDVLALQAT